MAKGRKTGGRQVGTLNHATVELKAIAAPYAPAAIAELARLMVEAQSEQARVAAANALLDRGYGKPPQAFTGAEGGPLVIVLNKAPHD